MALKKASSAKKSVKKAAPKKAAPAKRLSTRKSSRSSVSKTAKSVEKRAVAARPAPRPSRPEPPPVDHAQKLGPLFLGAGHGHLSRPVDQVWLGAIDRYVTAVGEATDYESKRSPQARASMVLAFGRQVQTLMQNLTLRIQAMTQEMAQMDPMAREQAQRAAHALVERLTALNAALGAMVGPNGMAPIGDASVPMTQLQPIEQMHRAHFNNIAKIADIERAVTG